MSSSVSSSDWYAAAALVHACAVALLAAAAFKAAERFTSAAAFAAVAAAAAVFAAAVAAAVAAAALAANCGSRSRAWMAAERVAAAEDEDGGGRCGVVLVIDIGVEGASDVLS